MHYTSVSQAALNLAYSMINVGLVGIPFVASEAGIPLFAIAVVLFSLVSIYTTSIVLEMADDVEVKSLEELGEKAFGPRGYFITCLLQILFSMLLICITLDVWGDIMPQLLRTIIGSSLDGHSALLHFLTHRRTVILLGALLVLPLCFVRSMSKLSWLSYLTVCALFMSVTFVLIALFRGVTCSGTDGNFCHLEEVYKPQYLWWTIQPLITFCFTYQQVSDPSLPSSPQSHLSSETIFCLQLFAKEKCSKN
jgi:amino acid permease